MQLDDILQDFLSEAEERFSLLETQLIVLERRPDNAEALAAVFRGAHSLKGTCGFLGFTRLGHLAHAAEDLMSYLRAQEQSVQGVHIDALLRALEVMRRVTAQIAAAGKEPADISADETDIITALQRMAAGEIAALPQIIEDAADPAALPTVRVGADVLDNLLALGGELTLAHARLTQGASAPYTPVLRHMSQLLADMQGEILRARMQPVMEAWRSLPRIVRDMAAAVGVRARLETYGGDAQLDRHVLDIVRDPIAHLVRNCLSHGLEPPAERHAAGKAEEGVIKLTARTAEGRMLLSVSDDGRGLDFTAIRKRAADSGIASATELAAMSEDGLSALVFRAGFSTARQVNDMAGRGVGLDAVSAQMALIGGTVSVAQQDGGGTVFTLSIPLTLAMIPAVVIRTQGAMFVVPRSAVAGFSRMPVQPARIGGQSLFEWRGRQIPLMSLDAEADDETMVVVVFAEGHYAAIRAAEIVATTQVLVKPLPPLVPQAGRYLGVTLLPAGAPALILDARQWALRHGATLPEVAEVPAKACTEYLVVHMNGRRMALPVKSVRQILRVPATALHRDAQGNMFWPQGDTLRPLKDAAAKPDAQQAYVVESVQGDAFLCEAVEGIQTADAAAESSSLLLNGQAADVLLAGASEKKSAGRILLVDDSDFFCSLLTPFLQEAGYDVTSVTGADEALALRDQGARFSLIISDIEMPGMSGLDFARDVKRGGSAWQHVPLMALSAHASRNDESRGRTAGFDDFITKFDRDGLLQKIAGLCGCS